MRQSTSLYEYSKQEEDDASSTTSTLPRPDEFRRGVSTACIPSSSDYLGPYWQCRSHSAQFDDKEVTRPSQRQRRPPQRQRTVESERVRTSSPSLERSRTQMSDVNQNSLSDDMRFDMYDRRSSRASSLASSRRQQMADPRRGSAISAASLSVGSMSPRPLGPSNRRRHLTPSQSRDVEDCVSMNSYCTDNSSWQARRSISNMSFVSATSRPASFLGEISFSLFYDVTCASLLIDVVQCRSLPHFGTHKPNPYVKVLLLPHGSREPVMKLKTSCRRYAVDPEFGEELRITAMTKSQLEEHRLIVAVWHKEAMGQNAPIGQVVIPLSDFQWSDDRLPPSWFPLEGSTALPAARPRPTQQGAGGARVQDRRQGAEDRVAARASAEGADRGGTGGEETKVPPAGKSHPYRRKHEAVSERASRDAASRRPPTAARGRMLGRVGLARGDAPTQPQRPAHTEFEDPDMDVECIVYV